jgi:hypothetical protein
LWTPKLSHPAKAQGRKAIGIPATLTAGESVGGLVQPPAFALEAKHMPVVIKAI